MSKKILELKYSKLLLAVTGITIAGTSSSFSTTSTPGDGAISSLPTPLTPSDVVSPLGDFRKVANPCISTMEKLEVKKKLGRDLITAQTDLAAAQNDLAAAQNDLATKKLELTVVQVKKGRLGREKSRIELGLIYVEQDRRTKDETIQKINQDLQNVNSQIQVKDSEIQGLNDVVSRLKGDVQRLIDELTKLKACNEQNLQKYEGEFGTSSGFFYNAIAQRNAKEAERAALETELAQEKASHEVSKKTIQGLEQAKTLLENDLADAQQQGSSTATRLQDDLISITAELDQAKQHASNRDVEIKRLSDEISAASVRETEFSEELKAAKASEKATAESLSSLTLQNDEAVRNLAEKTQMLEVANKTLQERAEIERGYIITYWEHYQPTINQIMGGNAERTTVSLFKAANYRLNTVEMHIDSMKDKMERKNLEILIKNDEIRKLKEELEAIKQKKGIDEAQAKLFIEKTFPFDGETGDSKIEVCDFLRSVGLEYMLNADEVGNLSYSQIVMTLFQGFLECREISEGIKECILLGKQDAIEKFIGDSVSQLKK